MNRQQAFAEVAHKRATQEAIARQKAEAEAARKRAEEEAKRQRDWIADAPRRKAEAEALAARKKAEEKAKAEAEELAKIVDEVQRTIAKSGWHSFLSGGLGTIFMFLARDGAHIAVAILSWLSLLVSGFLTMAVFFLITKFPAVSRPLTRRARNGMIASLVPFVFYVCLWLSRT